MKRIMFWSGKSYHSLENCMIRSVGGLTMISSVIVGLHNEKTYRIRYTIQTNADWQTLQCDLIAEIDGELQNYSFRNVGNNQWTMNGVLHPEFDGCTEVDISLTPLTNTLPINRLKLKATAEAEINVICMDVLKQEVNITRQKYKKVSADEYRFENVPNDFKAIIKVNAEGFVTDYPPLFVLTFSK
jgi:uncharacterized protein